MPSRVEILKQIDELLPKLQAATGRVQRYANAMTLDESPHPDGGGLDAFVRAVKERDDIDNEL
jgi:hypothetical protein